MLTVSTVFHEVLLGHPIHGKIIRHMPDGLSGLQKWQILMPNNGN